jgi:hypothetical protein
VIIYFQQLLQQISLPEKVREKITSWTFQAQIFAITFSFPCLVIDRKSLNGEHYNLI